MWYFTCCGVSQGSGNSKEISNGKESPQDDNDSDVLTFLKSFQNQVTNEFKNLCKDVTTIKMQNAEIIKALTYCSDRLDDLEPIVTAVASENKAISTRVKELEKFVVKANLRIQKLESDQNKNI